MRFFPTLAAALLTMTMVAACNRDGTSSTSQTGDQSTGSTDLAAIQPADQPAGDIAKSTDPMPADIPSASTGSETDAAVGSTMPPAATASSAQTTTQTAAQPTVTTGTPGVSTKAAVAPAMRARRVVKHHARHHHPRSVAKNHRHQPHRHPVAKARVQATGTAIGVMDSPQTDQQSDREQFKREMQSRVAEIGNGVSRYHNSASITDALTRYEQNIEDVKVADVLARRQLRTIDTVSNDNWPSFKSNFQNQVSQLEQDYHNLQQARR